MAVSFTEAESVIREEIREWLSSRDPDDLLVSELDDGDVAMLAGGIAFRMFCLGAIVADNRVRSQP